MAFRTSWNKGDFKLLDHEEIRWVFAHELDQFDFAPADIAFIEELSEFVFRNFSYLEQLSYLEACLSVAES